MKIVVDILLLLVLLFINYVSSSNILSTLCEVKKTCIIDCSKRNFTKVPEIFQTKLNVCVEELILSENFIERIEANDISGLTNLRVLRFSNNNINYISKQSFRGLSNLKRLHLNSNNISEIPSLSWLRKLKVLNMDQNQVVSIKENIFQYNPFLQSLSLSKNKINLISNQAFYGLERKLRILNLQGNRLKLIPSQIKRLKSLVYLDFTNNDIKFIQKDAFRGLISLVDIRLFDDDTTAFVPLNAKKRAADIIVHKQAFRYMRSLRKLELHYYNCKLNEFPDLEGTNTLREISVSGIKNVVLPQSFCNKKRLLQKISIGFCSVPRFPALNKCTKLHTIDFVENEIGYIPKDAFSGLELIENIEIIQKNTVKHGIHPEAFSNLPSLYELDLSEFPLNVFPNLTGTTSLRRLKLQNCDIKSIPKGFCQHLPNLERLDLAINKIRILPNLSVCKRLEVIDLFNNKIISVYKQFMGLEKLEYLKLSENHLQRIDAEVFQTTVSLTTLYMNNNLINFIHDNAFEKILNLEILDVSNNNLKTFPTKGLKSLVVVKVAGNKDLITFPTQEELPHARILKLVYHYHCCFFMKRVQQIRHEYSTRSLSSNSKWTVLSQHDLAERTTFMNTNETKKEIGMQNIEPLLQFLNNDTKLYFNQPTEGGDVTYDVKRKFNDLDERASCTPTPNDFYPCEDLMGSQWLRVCAWIVFLFALMGNICVLIVLTANCRKLDVPRYLVVNLAFADLCLGVYLGFLAFVDIITLGDFRLHALEWQFSGSCKAAGFLAVFSSELSVFTLAVITIERFTTIKHSMHIEKHINKNQAIFIMAVGWLFSATLAALPLYTEGDIKFNDYSKYSVCLPFETETLTSKVYVIFILVFNMLIFLIILVCYIKIYSFIRGSNAWNSGDLRAAKKMGILVFTDFICWFPIALVALSAASNNSLISDLWISKVLTILVFPLNACANPFLYAIFTKQFGKDIMSAIRLLREKTGGRRELRKSLLRLPIKGSLTYSTSVRRGSSCSFLFGRRSSKLDEVKLRTATVKLAEPEEEDEETPCFRERLTSV